MLHDQFRQCLESMDVDTARRIWKEAFPNMPQAPAGDEQCLALMHYTRTMTNTIVESKRGYSHAWLRERHLPSALPDAMRPKAEREHPVVVSAVGISVNATTESGRERALLVREAMENVVLNMYDVGQRDPVLVKKRIDEARDIMMKKTS